MDFESKFDFLDLMMIDCKEWLAEYEDRAIDDCVYRSGFLLDDDQNSTGLYQDLIIAQQTGSISDLNWEERAIMVLTI